MFDIFLVFLFFKQKAAYEMRISDWSSDVCSSDLRRPDPGWPCPRRSLLPACSFSAKVGLSRASPPRPTLIGSWATSSNCSGAGREIRRAASAELRWSDTEALSGAHAGLSALRPGETQDIRR